MSSSPIGNRVLLTESEPPMRAEGAIDRIVARRRAWHRKRERTFTARDALAALQFEVTFLHVASVAMRDSGPLSDADHARLVVACGRINVICDEVLA